MTFAEALAIAEAQYQQQWAAYVAALSPEHMEAIKRNAAKPRPVGRRITIERERATWFIGRSVRMWELPQ